MYKVSVIIPTYNSEKYIERTINSVINQSIGFENIELIIIDDNSSDNTKNILINYDLKYENIKCIFFEDNSGSPSRGRNTGIHEASSENVMFLDNDDFYDEFVCEKLCSMALKYDDCDIIMCNYDMGGNINIKPSLKNISKPIVLDPKTNKDIFTDIFMWNKLFKVSFLKEFDILCPLDTFSEDLYFCFKAYLNCDKLVYDDYVGYHYNLRDSENKSLSNDEKSYSQLIKFLKGFEKVYYIGKDNKDYFDCLMEVHFIFLIYSFVLSNTTYDEKIKFLEELYNFENLIGEVHINELWAELINKNIKNRKYERAITLSKIFKFIKHSDFMTKMYRKKYRS